MPTHPNGNVDGHLQRIIGNTGFTLAGNVATVTASINDQQLHDLLDGCRQQKFDGKLVAGALTLAPRV